MHISLLNRNIPYNLHYFFASYCYLSFFSDPSSAGIGCAKTGPVQFASSIAVGSGGEVREKD